MPKKSVKQETSQLLKVLDKVLDQHKALYDKSVQAFNDGDMNTALSYLDELIKFRPAFLRVGDQAEKYLAMLKKRNKRVNRKLQLKEAVN